MNLTTQQRKVISSFKQFVSFRNKIALILSFVILVCYYAFVLGVGLFPEVLGYRLGPSSITLGIMIGIFLIALSITLTGLYTFLANRYFDKEQGEILENLKQENVLKALSSGEISYKDKLDSSNS